MTRIRANCPSCGEVDLRPEDVRLDIIKDSAGEVGEGSTYRFPCPECSEVVSKPADERIARMLATGGVPIAITRSQFDDIDELVSLLDVEDLALHPELPEPGPTFVRDDLLTFHELLERDDWFDELRCLTR